ncbi:LD31742p [Strongyloides ratti]|uniref:carnitine O-palmitoyltransferase n=1 Tax=Strongyloides ratti TaxID=34506 RepID=A0A090LMU1_STRRB|nr:LD31742p [Strongyloides ratti]CEF71155.1 LD31742p [Strongyloides ratti]
MAEARSVAGINIALTHDGVAVSYDQELLRDIWSAFSRSYRKRIARFKNHFIAGIFPANIASLGATLGIVLLFSLLTIDVTFGIVTFLRNWVLYFLFGSGYFCHILSLLIGGSLFWFLLIQIMRLSLKMMLSYKGWMYQSPFEKNVTSFTKAWFSILHFISKFGPTLHSFQGALPHLPLPTLNETLDRHLKSIRPFTTDEEYDEMVILTDKFRKGLGRRLQRYLIIKSWLSVNYVSDWWEEFVYMRQRSPIMINSNYYGFDTLNMQPTNSQAARAANITWAALTFRRMIERQEVTPFALSPKSKVPFCTMQYERLFNSCRIPGEETDTFRVYDDAKHIAVYYKGCWFKLPIHSGKRLLEPKELQYGFQEIIDSGCIPQKGEDELAAFTAGERTPWAIARRRYFNTGINRQSLRAIERAAFVVILDDEEVTYDENDNTKLDRWASLLLHGKGTDRWYDKSFNFIIFKNGKMGINTEHSWGDAAVTAHFVEYCLLKDLCHQKYDEKGNCKGLHEVNVHPHRLRWDFTTSCLDDIKVSLDVAKKLIDDVEMSLLVWNTFGKRLIKKLGISPDAFLQLTLQLTYFRNQNKFALTYEASMTRLYREGRTETVRSCTSESCDFVRAMLNDKADNEERLELLYIAAKKHQELYRDAMCGKGVDRHLFALYVIKRYLEEESPFFDKIFPPTYLLSTSQTPLNQCEDESIGLSVEERASFINAGGGFGPVTDRGYGVSYIINGEDQLFFHISSKKSADNTSSYKFRDDLIKSLNDMKLLLTKK